MASPFGSILLVTGGAEFLADRVRRKAMAQIREADPACEVAESEAGRLGAGELAALTSPSLFSASSGLVITGLEDLADAPQAELLAYAAEPSPDVAVVLVHGGGNKGKGVLDKLRKTAAVHEVKVEAPKYERDHVTWVRREVTDLGASIDEEAAALLVTAVGQDLRALAGAADQLVSSVDRGTRVDRDVVARYFGGRADVRGFEIADAAIEGRLAAALEQLRWAEANKVAPVLVTSAGASGLRSLTKLADVRGGMRDNEVASAIGAPPFKVRALRSQLRGWEPEGLARAMDVVARTDVEVKGGGADPAYALERMVLQVAAARRG